MKKEESFELDLLDFHGEPVNLQFEARDTEAGWALGGAELPVRLRDNSSFRADLRAQLIETTIYIDGDMAGEFEFQCGRCMQWRPFELDESVTLVLMSRAAWADRYEGSEELSLAEEDLDVSTYDGEIIDLRPVLREALMLELPVFPRCPDELRAACDRDFENIVGEEKLAENEANSIDLRWAKLREINLEDGD